ncbi:MAG TPA: TetR/AcrR family transcriptional regulator [Vicinamibacterales bacterium]|nr:TetR/AcrR family transcriptional regulator [Vicinamibacterales bacterium]
MARPRFLNIDPARQEAVLQTAAREFAQFGYEGASINRILLAAGVSKGAFYYYFDDKADLATDVLLWAYRDIFALYDQIKMPEDAASFWTEIERFAGESLAVIDRAPYANQLVSRLSQAIVNDKELEAKVMHVFRRLTSTWITFLTRGQELGAIRADLPVRTLLGLFQAVKESLLREYTSNDHVLTNEEFAQVSAIQLDLFRRISAPPAKLAPPPAKSAVKPVKSPVKPPAVKELPAAKKVKKSR